MYDAKKEEERKKTFIDLNDHRAPLYAQSDARIKMVEMRAHRDLKAVTDMAYQGNILVLDFSKFADGDAAKNDIAKRLMDVARDMNGAFTEVSDRLMILSPSGLNIDKCRIAYKEG